MTLSIFKLTIAACIPIVASGLFYKLGKTKKFSGLSYAVQQIIIGVAFGIISIIGTEWGIPLNGVTINCRDAAPLAAGLLFGGPAGIIAGFMGGIERWFAVYWGVGSFTRVACSVSTCLAGLYAALVRKFLFENKKPTWGISLGVGVIMETLHLTMVLLTNIGDATKAVKVINICIVPMVLANGLSVMFSAILLTFMAGEFKGFGRKKGQRPIFDIIEEWLIIVLSISFIVSMLFDYKLQTNMINNQAQDLVESTLTAVCNDISDASDDSMLKAARQVGREITSGYYDITKLAEKYEFADISIIDKNGIIVESNNPEYVGYDMHSGVQSSAFLVLLDEEYDDTDVKYYIQSFGPISKNSKTYRKYAAVTVPQGFVQVGYDKEQFQNNLRQQIVGVASNRKLGDEGGVIIIDQDKNLISCTDDLNINEIAGGEENLASALTEFKSVKKTTFPDGNDYYCECRSIEGYYVVAFYKYEEAAMESYASLYVSLFSMLLIFAIMFTLIYMLIKKIVINQIIKMANSLSEISQGNLDEVVDVRSNAEFASLSDDINSTVDTLKRYIDEAAARIDKELVFAKSIQEAALPSVFPERDDYKIYCFMRTAKEVGGDFYDFYQTKDNILNFLIADVSGKGIPAAMFMMRAKSVLRSCTERGLSVDDVFTSGNDSLCDGNDAGMFVTAWQGNLDLDNGQVYFANAGHNLPCVKKKNGKYELLNQKVNLVLGGMEGLPYSLNETTLEPGDNIFLYTDGVTEATNANNVLYGENRLLDILNAAEYDTPKDVCEAVIRDIDKFVGEADQFDDITMVCLTYLGKDNKKD